MTSKLTIGGLLWTVDHFDQIGLLSSYTLSRNFWMFYELVSISQHIETFSKIKLIGLPYILSGSSEKFFQR